MWYNLDKCSLYSRISEKKTGSYIFNYDFWYVWYNANAYFKCGCVLSDQMAVLSQSNDYM